METVDTNSKRKIKIYVADNTDFRNKSTSYFNAKDNFEIVGSSDDGQKAFIDICALKPDVVIMECVLPSFDGFVIMDKLTERLGQNRPKIIIVSSLSHEGFISKAINQGVSYFLCKPVDMEIVEQRIYDVFDLGKQDEKQRPKNRKQIA